MQADNSEALHAALNHGWKTQTHNGSDRHVLPS